MKPHPFTSVFVNSMVGAGLRRRTAVAAILLLRLPHRPAEALAVEVAGAMASVPTGLAALR